MDRALGGLVLARVPASPVQGLYSFGPRYYNFPYFCMAFGLEKLDLIDKNDWGVICSRCC